MCARNPADDSGDICSGSRIDIVAAILATVLLSLCFSSLKAFAAEPVPYGHRDFYPSPERPIGFGGDGSSWYPGATPVSEFWEGTPTSKQHDGKDKFGKAITVTYADLADDKPKNIVWKTELPSWANSQPIVVGDRIFTLSQPWMLSCVDANSGKILWTAHGDPFLAAGMEPATAAKARSLYDVMLVIPVPRTSTSTTGGPPAHEVWKKALPVFQQVYPRLVAELKRHDAETDWQTPSDQAQAALKDCLTRLDEGKEIEKGAKVGALAEAIKNRIRDLGKGMLPRSGMPSEYSWGYMVGSMTAPVSDGARVYATYCQGLIMACDLKGNVLWQRWDGESMRTFSFSPLVAEGVVIWPRNGKLIGLEATSGKTLWEAPDRPEQLKDKTKGGYPVGTHGLVTLHNGKLRQKVIVTHNANILRPSDGKQMGYLPWPHPLGPSGGTAVISSPEPANPGARIVFRDVSADGGKAPMTGFRLRLIDAERVEVDVLKNDYGPNRGYVHQIATDKYLITTGSIYEAPTGNVIVAATARNQPTFGGHSGILAGNFLIAAEEGNNLKPNGMLSDWKRRREDGKAFGRFHVYEMSDPAKPKLLSRDNLLGGSAFPRMPAMERLAPELYAALWWTSTPWGKPAHFLHADSTITAQGNRLFIRGIGHLYCVGDPAVPYDWNPASRPAQLKAGL